MLNKEQVNNDKYKLNDLIELVDKYIPVHIKKVYPSINCKSRLNTLISLRCIYTMLAVDMGYSYSDIARNWNKDHATSIHNSKIGYNLLEVDKDFQQLYIRISKSVNPKIYPHARINEIIDKEPDNTRPIFSSRLHTRKYNVTRPAAKQGRRSKRIKEQAVS